MRMTDRIKLLELKGPGRTLGPYTTEQMKGIDDLTLCRFAIQEAERAIAAGSGRVPFDLETQRYLGVANDDELLALLREWLGEMEVSP